MLVLAATLGVLASCTSESAPDGPDRSVQIYAAVLTWLLEHEAPVAPGPSEERERPLVYVDHLGPEQLDLQVQIELVSRFDEEYELRFIDATSEALDSERINAPVRQDRLLIGLGPVPDTFPFSVRAEVYRNARDIDAYRFEVVRWTGEWVLGEEPEVVEPEGFITTS